MKTRISLISFALLMAASLGSWAQTKTVRENIPCNSITNIKAAGKTHLVWIHDKECYVQISYDQQQIDPKGEYYVSVDNNTLTFNDGTGKLNYELHLDSNNVEITLDGSEVEVTFPNGVRHTVNSIVESSFTSIGNELKGLIDELVYVFDSVSNATSAKSNSSPNVNNDGKKRRKYSVADRTNFDFHWGFNNWGDQWYNGLMKMEGPYNLRTSFSSYQLSENYAIVMTPHTKLSIGIGYESDVYKFTDNYVSMDVTNGAFMTQDQAGVDAVSNVAGSNLGNWSTRLVTRYVTMPIEFEYRDKGVLRNFRISLGVIPGLSFSSKNTGLKHELEQRGRNYQDSQSGVSRFINPYKLDVRLTFKRKGLGMFLQVPTLPVFIDTATKVYPIKIGFML
ncbi:MAG: hypothetical protein II661_05675 [Bacteroidales bacterium]|nr:hypothetical protein [Bacteroidales bacterium]